MRRCSLLVDISHQPNADPLFEKKIKERKLTDLRTTRIHKRRNLTLQQIQRPRERVAQRLAPQKVWYNGQGQLIEEADEFRGVGEVGSLISAAGDVAKVGAGEAIDGSGIAADGNGFGDDGGDLHEILGEGDGAVFVDGAEGAPVPVVGDALVAWLPG